MDPKKTYEEHNAKLVTDENGVKVAPPTPGQGCQCEVCRDYRTTGAVA